MDIDPDKLWRTVLDIRNEIHDYLDEVVADADELRPFTCDVSLWRMGVWHPHITGIYREENELQFYWDDDMDSPVDFDQMITEDLIDIVRSIRNK